MSKPSNEQQSTPPVYVPPYAMYPYAKDDEINLGDLWQILVEKKRIIAASVAVSVLAAAGYLVATDKVYENVALTLPPLASDVQGLNVTDLQTFTPSEIYAQFLTNATSVHVQRKAFYEIVAADPQLNALSDDEKRLLFRSFAAKLAAVLPKKDKDASVEFVAATKLRLEHINPDLARKFIDKTLELASQLTISNNRQAVSSLVDQRLGKIPQDIERLKLAEKMNRETEIAKIEEDLRTKRNEITQQIAALKQKLENEKLALIAKLEEQDNIARQTITEKIDALRAAAKINREAEISRLEFADQIKREELQKSIQVLRNSAKDKRADRIEQLSEAANIAQKLGIQDPIASYKNASPNSPLMAYVEISTRNNEPPLYLNGERALRAEIKELNERKDDDSFIPELRSLLDQLANLERNPNIEALKSRTNDDPFITELPDLKTQLTALEINEEIEALKTRTSNDLFSPELLELNRQLELLNESSRMQTLKTRQDDAPFAGGIKALSDEQRKLETIKTNLQRNEASSAATIDRKAYTEPSAVKPKFGLMLALALVAGSLIGIFAAFFAHFIGNQRKRSDERATPANNGG